MYLVDSHEMPQDIDRYFMPISLERVRGIMAATNFLLRGSIRISEKDMEDFAKAFATAMIQVSPKFSKQRRGTRGELLAALYRSALTYVLRKSTALPDNVRSVLAREFRT